MEESLEHFPLTIRKILLKKETEYGQLKFISSRATEETARFIDELLEEITKIAQTLNMYNAKLFYENDSSEPSSITPLIIGVYNHFILNTGFSSQPFLIEDLMSGHLVHSWPTLSPYLFIQIIWHIKCEDLLIESLVHLPLDLCMDILEITIRCINDLGIVRARRFAFLLISKLYYKCLWLHLGTLSQHDIMELVYQLVAHFQALLNLVSSKFVTPTLSDQEKYVQHGILLKEILRCVKTCMRYKTKNFPVKNEEMQLFEITYGNPNGSTDYFCKLPIDKSKSVIATLDQELIALLLNQIKQVDCFEFMGWAEVDDDNHDDENVTISLQRAVIIECHYFMEFMKRDEFLSANDHLLQCLEQLVGPNKPEEPVLTLEELCNSIENGKLDNMRELIKYYRKWDLSVLKFVSGKRELLSTKDVGVLLEYLDYMFARKHDFTEKHQAYLSVLKVLMAQKLSDMYNIVLHYTVQHFHNNRLELLFDNESFKRFIESNVNMRDHQTLCILLTFVMLNPKRVLSTLVSVAIGSTNIEYQNVMFKRPQMHFLYSFLVLRLSDQSNLLTYILNDIWRHDHSTWCYKQFEAFMNDMLHYETITPDDLLSNVYIPCLTGDAFNCSNLLSVLIHMYSVLKKNAKRKTNHVLLITELINKMSVIRKCNPTHLRSTVNNLLDRGTMILNFLFASLDLTVNSQSEIISKVNNFVEPIDQIFLAPKLQTILRGTVQDVIQSYERRCLATYQLLCANSVQGDYNFQLDKRALLRHMMLHATEEEYKNFAIELTIVSWSYFCWANELEAYENVLRITAEAMQLALMFTDTFSKDTFVSLLRALVHYCNTLLRLKHQNMCKHQEAIFSILSKTLSSLKSTVDETRYGKMYENLLEQIDNMSVNSNSEIRNYIRRISELIEEYFVPEEIENEKSNTLECEESHSAPTTSEIVDMYKAYQFVCKCIDDSSYGKKMLRS